MKRGPNRHTQGALRRTVAVVASLLWTGLVVNSAVAEPGSEAATAPAPEPLVAEASAVEAVDEIPVELVMPDLQRSDPVAGFDGKLAQAMADAPQGPGVGVAGRVVERFAPPVASGSGSSAFAAGTDGRGSLAVNALRPCDTPGAACRNFGGPRAITAPVNAPIVAGTRPGGGAQ